MTRLELDRVVARVPERWLLITRMSACDSSYEIGLYNIHGDWRVGWFQF